MDKNILLFSLVIVSVLSLVSCQQAPWRKGRYWYIIDNIEVDDENPEILLWVALPMDHIGQTVKIEDIHPQPVDIIHDSINGNDIVLWKITDLYNKDRIYCYYDFQVLPERVETTIDPENIIPYQKEANDYKRYTQSEPWIEMTPAIKEKAIEIVGNETNPYFQARKIFTWVIENMSYEYPDVEKRGAEKSFKTLKGDCGEFSSVFVALCRAVGIPARNVTCIWFQGGGHAWAEILLPPYGWVPVDPSVAQALTPGGSQAFADDETVQRFMESRGIPIKDPYYVFGNLYPNRVIVYLGVNVEAVSHKTGITKTFKFMQPGGLAALPPGVEFKGLWAKTVQTGFFIFGDERDDVAYALEKAEKELAPSYLQVGLYDKAERGLLKKIEERPDDALSWLNLGEVYVNKKEYDKAIEAFNKCLSGKAGSIKPVLDAWAHNLLGNCYDIKGMRNQARAEYQHVIDANINFQGAVDSAKHYIDEPFREPDE
jgi:tetratricopeptide (TPR) repeat protein